ncbi:MAG TPA: beta-propeller fold lactonase family protein [Candidatus Acidoferrum sp.]|nr:beta-propeller fold lactonase family protein [Candidatus Acidoferrum sp.]
MRLKFSTCLWILAALAFTGSWPNALHAQSTRLYVGNSIADNISVIDLDSLKVVGDIHVGPHVHGMAVQADGARLFSTSEGDNTLRIFDTSTDKRISEIKLTGRPNQCAVTPDGKYVAIPIRDTDSVDIVDVAQQKVVKVLPVNAPHNAFNAGSNRYIFVSSMGDHAINMIDLEKMDYAASIPTGGVPRPYVITRDGRTMYVAESDLHGFAVVDILEKKVVRRVEMPAEHPTPHEHPGEPINTLTHGLALSPDEKELWVTSLLDDAMYVYDVSSQKIVGHVPVGSGPNWVAFSPDGKYVCVSNAADDNVSIIDVKARREVARVKVGRVPKRLVAASVLAGEPIKQSPSK